jgi:O-antigen ligase
MFSEKLENIFLKLTHASLWILAIFTFVSFSASALHHILLVPPGIYFTSKALKKGKFSLPLSAWALCSFILIAIISILLNYSISTEPVRNIFKLKYFIIPLLGFFALKEFHKKVATKKIYANLLNTFLASTSLATLAGLIALITNFNFLRFKPACHATRACGAYGMYMSYGYGIALFMILLIGLYIHRKKLEGYFNQNLLIVAIFINLLGLYFSEARGAWLGFFGAIPFYFFAHNKKKFMIIALGSVLTLAALFFLSPRVKEAFTNREGSNLQRISFWMGAIEAFKEKPILGYGYKNYEPNSVAIKTKHQIAYPEIQGHAHSNYLEVLATTGILGILAFLLFNFFWFRENAFTHAFIICFAISGVTQVTWGDGENLFFIMIIYALSLIVKPAINK